MNCAPSVSGVVSSDGREVVVPFSAVVERQMGGVLAVPLRVTDAGSPSQSATVTLTLARASGSTTLTKETKHITVAAVKVGIDIAEKLCIIYFFVYTFCHVDFKFLIFIISL